LILIIYSRESCFGNKFGNTVELRKARQQITATLKLQTQLHNFEDWSALGSDILT